MVRYFLHSSFSGNKVEADFFGFSYNSQSLILDKEGFRDFLVKYGFEEAKKLQGQFYSLVKYEGDAYVITDILGSEPVFYYKTDKAWAFSNSMFHLAEHLANQQEHITLNSGVVDYFGLQYSLCEQLIGPSTFVKEISMLMPGEILKLGNIDSGGEPSLTIINSTEADDKDGISYLDLIAEGIREVGNVLYTLEKIYPTSMSIDLTGGVDSRVVFGIAKRSLEDLGSLHISSSVSHAKDYEVAKKISRYLDLDIDNKKPKRLASDPLSYESWLAFNLGVYAPIKKPQYSADSKEWFHVHGGAGEVLRSFYPNTPRKTVEVLERKFNCDLSGLREILKDFCDSRGIDFNCKSSMPRIYLESRSRIHFGRPSFNHSLHRVFMPLANRNFLQAARKLSIEDLVRSRVLFDILSSTAPELLGFDYDDSSKMLKGEINKKLAELVSAIRFDSLQIFCSSSGSSSALESSPDQTFEELLNQDLEKLKEIANDDEIKAINLSSESYQQAIQMRKSIHALFFKGLLCSDVKP